MTEPHAFDTCFLCSKSYQMGPHVYEGRNVATWGVGVCNSCRRFNQDGVVETPELLKRMEEKGITPTYNNKGHIIIPG